MYLSCIKYDKNLELLFHIYSVHLVSLTSFELVKDLTVHLPYSEKQQYNVSHFQSNHCLGSKVWPACDEKSVPQKDHHCYSINSYINILHKEKDPYIA